MKRLQALTHVGPLSEAWVLTMAVAAFGAAAAASRAPAIGTLGGSPAAALVLSAAVVVVAVALRRPILVVMAVALMASVRSGAEDVAYQPIEAGHYDGIVTLITDPEASWYGWTAEVSLADGSRVRLNAHGGLAAALTGVSAGQSMPVTGSLRPTEPSAWLRSRHIVGSLSATDLGLAEPAPWYYRPSETLRDLVASSASVVPYDLAPLYLGLVIGDDREQTQAQTARFRAAGLTHLLAVSGQNVAFVLAAVGPLLARLGVRGRLGVILIVLGVFAIATRLEPSVMRATFTAGLAAWSVALGRRSAGVRALGLATTALILVDPFLVWSVGFQLSVGASLAIVLFAPAMVSLLPGSGPLAQSAGITLAAQIGVAPIMFAVFGPVSVVTLPANVLAGWAAGLVMMWGMSAGLVAGLFASAGWPPGTALGAALQWPAVGLVWWIDTVGTYAARAPLPLIGPLGAGVLAASFVIDRGLGGRALGRIGLAVLWLALLGPSIPAPPTEASEIASDAVWYPASDQTPSVLVLGGGADQRVVEALVSHHVHRVDVLIVGSATSSAGRLANQVVALLDPGLVLAPPQHRVVEGTRVLADLVVPTVDGVLEVRVEGDRLVAESR